MRPRGYYVVFEEGHATTITHGAAEARRLTPHRSYRRFENRLSAEEYASWWNYQRERGR